MYTYFYAINYAIAIGDTRAAYIYTRMCYKMHKRIHKLAEVDWPQ
jgi:hypothetical protein